MRHWLNVALMLGQRRGRWTSIKTAFDRRFVSCRMRSKLRDPDKLDSDAATVTMVIPDTMVTCHATMATPHAMTTRGRVM